MNWRTPYQLLPASHGEAETSSVSTNSRLRPNGAAKSASNYVNACRVSLSNSINTILQFPKFQRRFFQSFQAIPLFQRVYHLSLQRNHRVM